MRLAWFDRQSNVMALTAIVATGAACGGRQDRAGVAPTAGSGPVAATVVDAATCRDEAEACRPDGFGLHTCPEGWGVCTRCADTCQATLVFRHDDKLTSQPIDPLGAISVTCTGATAATGATYQLGYDTRGWLADSFVVFGDGRREEVHLERDDDGWPLVLRTVGAEDHTVRWYRDAAGRVTREEKDDGSDFKIDREEMFERDPAGRTLRQRVFGSGGQPGKDIQFSYDGEGRVVREVTDHDGDGTPDADYRTRRDGAGRVFEVWRDDDGDGKANRIEHTLYDAGGRVTRTWTVDQRGRTTTDERRAYDPSGHLVRTWSDPDGRGPVEWSTWHEVDGAGRPVRTRHDSDGDGKVDLVVERSYDASGREVLERTDEGADGSFDERGSSYDASGRRVRIWRDVGGDGSLEMERVNVYDPTGLWVERRLTRRNLTSVTRYIHDAQRREIGTTIDAEDDGRIDETTTTQYDGAGRTTLHRDRNGETRWRYDDQGRLVERTEPNAASEGRTRTCQFRYDDAQWARWRTQAPAAVIQESPSAPTED